MYTGMTEKPCCLCDQPDTTARIELPPRAVTLMKHGDPIAWQDIVSTVTIFFCSEDWQTVRELVLETRMSPLSRCNVARASFDLRADFEALVNERKELPDHDALEDRLRSRSEAVIDGRVEHEPSDRELVEAYVIRWALEDLAEQQSPST
jgi:hypothetical protein